MPTHNITFYRNSNNKCKCTSIKNRSASIPLHLISPGAMVGPWYQRKQRPGSTRIIPYHQNVYDESAICLEIMRPVLRIRAAFRKHSEGSSVSEPDFRSGHPSSRSLSVSRIVSPNPPAGYHVIFVAQCGTLEAQPSKSTDSYAKAPMMLCRLSVACSGCDARLLSTLCVTNEPITAQDKDPALLFAYREQC